MKRKLMLLLILIMIVPLCACGQTETEAPSDVSSSEIDESSVTQDVPESTVSIEITPPDGWTPVEGTVLPVQYMKGTASFMVKDEPFAGETLDDVVNEALEIYNGSFDNLEVQGEAEPFTVDEKDARKLTFSCTIGSINMKFLYVYLFAADKTYVITFGDRESTFDALNADYETILNDIRFVTN